MGVHVLTDINVTFHDHLAGETWLEQYSRALETYGAITGNVSVELVGLFLVNWTSICQPNRLEQHFHARKRMAQATMLFRLGARRSRLERISLCMETHKGQRNSFTSCSHPRNSEEPICTNITTEQSMDAYRCIAQTARASVCQRQDSVSGCLQSKTLRKWFPMFTDLLKSVMPSRTPSTARFLSLDPG